MDTVLATNASIDKTAREALVPHNQRLSDAIRNSEANGLPSITVSSLQGQYLAIQAQLMGAKTVLEIGTLGGYSALWFAEEAGCKVTSIEIDPKHRDVALQNVKDLAKGQVEVILGAALDVMPKLAEEGRLFDMVFIDANWGEQWEYFDWAVKLTRKKGCIYVDNVVRKMRQESAEGKDLDQDSLPAKVGSDKRVRATLIQTVSSLKNAARDRFDGFLIAVVE